LSFDGDEEEEAFKLRLLKFSCRERAWVAWAPSKCCRRSRYWSFGLAAAAAAAEAEEAVVLDEDEEEEGGGGAAKVNDARLMV
jgi:hypothetical protein